MLRNELISLEKLWVRVKSENFEQSHFLKELETVSASISSAWERAIFSDVHSHSLERYFHVHLEGLRKFSDALYLSPQHGQEENINYVIPTEKMLIRLIELIHTSYSKFFNPSAVAPNAYRRAFIADLTELNVAASFKFKSSAFPESLIALIDDYFKTMMCAKGTQTYSYQELFYFKALLTAISLSDAGDIAAVLERHNFNHLAFLNYKIKIISEEADNLPYAQKLVIFRNYRRSFQWKPLGNMVYDQSWPALSVMLSGWLTEQIAIIEKAALIAPDGYAPKLFLNISVAHLACLLRMFFEENLFMNITLTDLFRFITVNYRTKRQDNISAASLSKEYYSVNQVSAAVIRDILQKMILRINRTFFPVLAAIAITSHFFQGMK